MRPGILFWGEEKRGRNGRQNLDTSTVHMHALVFLGLSGLWETALLTHHDANEVGFGGP